VVKSAQGETSRFDQLLAEYQRAPEVTRERIYLDTIESVMFRSPKVMIDIPNGNNLMFLPLDQLMSGTAGARNGLQGLSGTAADTKSLIDEFKSNVNRNRSRETRE